MQKRQTAFTRQANSYGEKRKHIWNETTFRDNQTLLVGSTTRTWGRMLASRSGGGIRIETGQGKACIGTGICVWQHLLKQVGFEWVGTLDEKRV